jgi:tetratricopeptide (TPR) repeat protein
MITRLVISLFILSVFFFNNCFVSWAALPQVCIDAERHINLKVKKNLYTQCIHSGKLSDYESSMFYTNRGITYEHLKENKLAIRDYDRALKLIQTAMQLSNVDDSHILDTLAAVYAKLGQFDKAIDAQSKAIKISEERGGRKSLIIL